MKITFNDVVNIFDKHNWKQFVCDLGNLKIYKVDGNYVRTNIFIDFVLGGHDYVYKFVPKNEIWIESLTNTKDMVFSLMHELYERRLMKVKKLKYDPAHKLSAKFEKRLRNIYDK